MADEAGALNQPAGPAQGPAFWCKSVVLGEAHHFFSDLAERRPVDGLVEVRWRQLLPVASQAVVAQRLDPDADLDPVTFLHGHEGVAAMGVEPFEPAAGVLAAVVQQDASHADHGLVATLVEPERIGADQDVVAEVVEFSQARDGRVEAFGAEVGGSRGRPSDGAFDGLAGPVVEVVGREAEFFEPGNQRRVSQTLLAATVGKDGEEVEPVVGQVKGIEEEPKFLLQKVAPPRPGW